jgi:hypothetical protein
MLKTLTPDQVEALWLTDFRAFARDHLKIQPMLDKNAASVGGTQLLPLLLNDPQDVLDKIISEIKGEGRPLRMNILKARREGVSTYVSGRFYWMTTTRFNRYSMLIAHEPESTEFLFQMHKRFLQNDDIWKPQTTYNNKKLLNFDTADGKGLGSAIRVATAGKEDVGSGQAIHYLHLSEMAKYPPHVTEALLTSVLQCVPQSADTEVIIESTAKGLGGQFYERYWGAKIHYGVRLKDGKIVVDKTVNKDSSSYNEFCSVFLPWFIFRRYTMDVPDDFVRTKDEEDLVLTYGLSDGQLVWRRWCIATNCNNSIDTFKQEYPSNPREAFIASGDPVFDVNQLQRLIDAATDPVVKYTIRVSDGQFVASREAGEFSVWEESILGEEYIVSGDVSEGINRNTSGKVADYSCAQVWKCSTGQQVAEWHGKVDPDQFGLIMAYIGQRYNMAYLVPERNNHGNSTVLKLSEIRYPRIYVERVPEPPNKIRKRYGWLTTRNNKKDIVDNMKAEMRDGTHGIRSKELLHEMMSFKQEGQEYGADTGMFDDRVMAAMIGKFTLPVLRSNKYRRENRATFTNEPIAPPPPVVAWMI